MVLRIYNTLSRKKELFEPLNQNEVRMYVCGPTVYDNAHVGHGMSSLVFDILRRYIEHKGYTVNHVMNYTDVDDKIINRANALNIDPLILAQKYIDEYMMHLDELNILPATKFPKATDEMGNIIRFIEKLVENESAYVSEGDVYFDVESNSDYGKLSGRRTDELISGTRTAITDKKHSALDFALWKSAKPGEPYWDSPWGQGRPGWHIECSSMSLNHLGEQIDIHGGGTDLIFPHHENEIAQTESVTGKPFAKYWVHNGMLQFSGEKMSKSLGNLVTIEDFLQEYPADVLRMLVLNSNYRSPLKFNNESLGHAKKALARLLTGLKPPISEGNTDISVELATQISTTREGFEKSMDDDFNTAAALGYIFDSVRALNQAKAKDISSEQIIAAQESIRELAFILGLKLEGEKQGEKEINSIIQLMIDVRFKLREEKQWALSDEIRDELLKKGIVLEDSKNGTIWHWK